MSASWSPIRFDTLRHFCLRKIIQISLPPSRSLVSVLLAPEDALGTQDKGEAGEGAGMEEQAEWMEMVILQI